MARGVLLDPLDEHRAPEHRRIGPAVGPMLGDQAAQQAREPEHQRHHPADRERPPPARRQGLGGGIGLGGGFDFAGHRECPLSSPPAILPTPRPDGNMEPTNPDETASLDATPTGRIINPPRVLS